MSGILESHYARVSMPSLDVDEMQFGQLMTIVVALSSVLITRVALFFF
jgi:hypothetical protein